MSYISPIIFFTRSSLLPEEPPKPLVSTGGLEPGGGVLGSGGRWQAEEDADDDIDDDEREDLKLGEVEGREEGNMMFKPLVFGIFSLPFWWDMIVYCVFYMGQEDFLCEQKKQKVCGIGPISVYSVQEYKFCRYVKVCTQQHTLSFTSLLFLPFSFLFFLSFF